MAIKDSAEVGENLMKIIRRLMVNQTLLKMLYYTDKDPLSQPDIPEDIIKHDIYNKLIRIIPKLAPVEDGKSIISIKVDSAEKNFNTEFRDVKIIVEVFVPITQWFLKSDNLRPYIILGEVQKSLEGKSINGMGRIYCEGFSYYFGADDMTVFQEIFHIITYD